MKNNLFTVAINTIWDSLKFSFAPPVCLLCKTIIDTKDWTSEHICVDCFESLPKALSAQEILNRINQNFGKEDNPFNFAFSLFDSSSNSKYLELIHAFKYYKFKNFGIFLGQELAKIIRTFLQNCFINFDAIVPVPIHKAKQRERGFNQSEIIGYEISKCTGLPLKNIIYRNRYTATQTKLNAEDRKKNVQNAFNLVCAAKDVCNKNFLLIDDVLTTGATLVSCGKLLKENNANTLALAVITTA
ncbi:MAG: ComF family protein [Candidatus Kapaibacteriales bacterium]